MDWHERLKSRFDQLGWSKVKLANKSEVPYSSVVKYLAGKVDKPRGDTPAQLAKALGVEELWLTAGVGPKFPRETSNNSANVGIKRVPLLDFHSAVRVEATWHPADASGVDTVAADEDVGERAFALRFVDDSMLPEFEAGQTAIFDPDAEIKPGRFVVAVMDGSPEATVRKYQLRGKDGKGNDIIELTPLNDDYPTLRIDEKTPGRVIARLVRAIKVY